MPTKESWRHKALLYSLIVLSVVGAIQFADALPQPDPVEAWDVTRPGLCSVDIDVDTLCQRCAKSTRSNIVYPTCCRNEDGVMSWCKVYLG